MLPDRTNPRGPVTPWVLTSLPVGLPGKIIYPELMESCNLDPTSVAGDDKRREVFMLHECIWSLLRGAGPSVSGSKIPCELQFQ